MVSHLLSLPWDTQLLIYLKLPLSAIVSLRKTCKRLNLSISSDKQLWVKATDEYVISKNINLHPSRKPLESASATHVESWISHNAYKAGAQNYLAEDYTYPLNGGSTVKQYYLPGPVVDGSVDDDGANVVVALTIGTKNMYIHVLSLCEATGVSAICSLATLTQVSYVRSLNGPWIVCAVRNGDDTYPTLINWETSRCWKLVPRWYLDHANSPWGMLHCSVCTATRWQDWFVVITNKTVEVFRGLDSENSEEQLDSIASLPIFGITATIDSDVTDVEEASFHIAEGYKQPETHSMLSFSCREKGGLYKLFSILYVGSEFIIREGYLENEATMEGYPASSNKFVVGPASNYEVHLCVHGGYSLLPSLVFVNIDRSQADVVGVTRPREIKEGFPLLHFTTSIDFDDGVGLLVLGTCTGCLCFARFVPEEMIAMGSFMDELPARKPTNEELSVVPVNMDIPPYYIHAQKSMSGFDLPLNIIEETIATWSPLASGSLSTGPWSNDWLRYESVRYWAVPADRWPMNDVEGCFDALSAVSYIRMALTAYGDIIPLAYRLDPEVVFFRIGPRYYMLWIQKDEDGEFEYDASVLPNFDIEAPLQGEDLENLRRSSIRGNLARYGNSGGPALSEATSRINYLLKVVSDNAYRLESELSKVGSDPNFWTTEDIQMMHRRVLFWM